MDKQELVSEILRLKKIDLTKQKLLLPPENIRELAAGHHRQPRSLKNALLENSGSLKVIGCIQKYSCNAEKQTPETGNFDFLQQARDWEEKKAAAVAVVTEKHFYGGAPSMLTGITHLIKLPVIRWDFIVDEYEVFQSKLWGADVVKINAALLDQLELAQILRSADALDLECIVQVKDRTELFRLQEFKELITALFIEENNIDWIGEIAAGYPAILLPADLCPAENIPDNVQGVINWN